MAEDKQVRKYAENLSYGKDSLASEIHGKANQERINKSIASCVRNYDKHMAEGNKGMAAHFKGQIEKWNRELNSLKAIKEEFFMNYASGRGGERMYSNYTDLSWDRDFFTERGQIALGDDLEFRFGVANDKGEMIWKKQEDITENWVVKGVEENDFMRLQQSAVKQRNDMGKPLDFDVDWEVSRILEKSDAWKVMASDKIGGRYFLNDYVVENQKAIESGQIPDDMLHPDSFNANFDNRLHQYYADRLRKAFDPNYQTPLEARKADELMAKTKTTNTEETNTENTQV
tara:strand:- start:2891 stop:3751 length:861 start_codon:yes stop_codon:yes gene_type:complete